MEGQEPAVVLKNEDVGGGGAGALQLIADGCGDVFKAANPGDGAVKFDIHKGHWLAPKG